MSDLPPHKRGKGVLWVCQSNGSEICAPGIPHINDKLPPQARKCGYRKVPGGQLVATQAVTIQLSQ